LAFDPKAGFSKRQRELDQKDRAAERAARRADRKARKEERAAAGIVGPEIGEAIDPHADVPPPAPEAQRAPSPAQEAAMRLFVGNLAFDVRAEDVRELFSSIGEVTDVHVVTDRDTGRSRGFAFVTMASGQAAKKAISELDGAVFGERQIRVNQAEERSGGGGRRRF
jgi:hypothetical protein